MFCLTSDSGRPCPAFPPGRAGLWREPERTPHCFYHFSRHKRAIPGEHPKMEHFRRHHAARQHRRLARPSLPLIRMMQTLQTARAWRLLAVSRRANSGWKAVFPRFSTRKPGGGLNKAQTASKMVILAAVAGVDGLVGSAAGRQELPLQMRSSLDLEAQSVETERAWLAQSGCFRSFLQFAARASPRPVRSSPGRFFRCRP